MEIISRDMIDYTVAGHSLIDIANYNEYLVLKLMREVYKKDDGLCSCSLCVEDIFALTLNSLSPRYIQVTSVRTYEESKYFIKEEEVRAKLMESVEKVRSNPTH